MYLARPLGIIAICCIPYISVQAQTNTSAPSSNNQSVKGKITGKLVDAQKQPLSYTTVTLLREDSSVVNGDLSKEDGSFSISAGEGTYLLRISGIGIKTRTIPGVAITAAKPIYDLGIINEATSAKTLKAVEVVGERPLMQMNVDKKVFNVEKNITTAGGTASDVLQNVPSVSVDVDGNISLRGKDNPTVLIDGKPATLLGGDVATALQSLPASSVESVEVITNPSAKYDAQGMSGIINIITKRDNKFGFNGSVSAGAGTRDKYNGNLSLNLKNNKWNFFLNSNFKQNRNYNHHTQDRINVGSDTAFHTYEDNLHKFSGLFNTIGAEYTIDKHNTITLTENLNKMQWGGGGYANYQKYAGSLSDVLSRQYRTNDHSGGPFSTSTTLDYKHKFKKEKQELTASGTFAKTWVKRTQDYATSYYNESGVLERSPIYEYAPGSGDNTTFTGQTDFTTPFLTKTGKLDAGVKTQLYWFNSRNNPTLDSNGYTHIDSVLLSNYSYTQQIDAGYVNLSDQFGKWGYQAGLRLEYSNYSGSVNSTSHIDYTNSYLNLFPSAYLSYKMKEDQSFYLNYSRRINRPSFFQLIPFVDLSNPLDTNVGNPNLRPEFIHNIELSYNKQFKKGNSLMASVYYQYTQNLIERYKTFYSDGTTFTQPKNLSSGTTYGFELTGHVQMTRFWDATLNMNFFQNNILGTNIDPTLNNSGFSWFGKLNTNLRLPYGFSFQLNANYEAPKVAGQGRVQEVYWVDAALRKSLLKNKAAVVLNVSDIFNTRKYTTEYTYPMYTMTDYRDRETRIGNITFTYNFGHSESSPKGMGNGGRRKQSNGNAPEKDKDRQNLKTDENNDQGGF